MREDDTVRSPGWHPDPDDARFLRWWNGLGWSDARRTVEGVRTPLSTAPVVNAPRAATAPQVRPPGSTVPRVPSSTVGRAPQSTVPGPPTHRAGRTRGQNGAASAAMILGVMSLPLGLLVLPSVLAILLGLAGLGRAALLLRRTGRPSGVAPSLIGLVLGVVTLSQNLPHLVRMLS